MGNCVRGHRHTKTLHTPHDSSIQAEDHHTTSLPIAKLQATHPLATCTEDFGKTNTGAELPHSVVNTHLDSGFGVSSGNTILCSTSLPPCEHIEVVTTLSPTMARLLDGNTSCCNHESSLQGVPFDVPLPPTLSGSGDEPVCHQRPRVCFSSDLDGEDNSVVDAQHACQNTTTAPMPVDDRFQDHASVHEGFQVDVLDTTALKPIPSIGWILPDSLSKLLSVSPKSGKNEDVNTPMSPMSEISLAKQDSDGDAHAHCGRKLFLSRDFKPGAILGTGSFGQVFAARHEDTGTIMAVKEIPIQLDSNKQEMEMLRIQREVGLCEQLDNPRIVQYFGFDIEPNQTNQQLLLYLFLEYCNGGSVASHLKTFGPMRTSLVAKYAQQLLEGVHYLHSQNPPVVHRDLKGANILLTHDANVKIADFGCSKWLAAAGGRKHTAVGTIFWMAPEVLQSNGNKLSTAVDIWSLGCCLIEMAKAKHPWAECHLDNLFSAWRVIAETEELPAMPVEWERDHPMACFVEACLVRDPEARPCAAELLRHSLVKVPTPA